MTSNQLRIAGAAGVLVAGLLVCLPSHGERLLGKAEAGWEQEYKHQRAKRLAIINDPHNDYSNLQSVQSAIDTALWSHIAVADLAQTSRIHLAYRRKVGMTLAAVGLVLLVPQILRCNKLRG